MWHRFRRNNDGFTMIELVVTMVIISTVLLGLVGLQISAFATVGQAKQRQQATALANQAMEEIRALPYATVSGGLNSGDLAGDPNISGSLFRPTFNSSISETLVTSNNVGPVPLYPHVQTTQVATIPYTVSTYVTLVGADPTQGYWLTVAVSWNTKATGGAVKTIATRSRLFSPSGCLSTTDHPFSGPCQNFFDGSAGTTLPNITIISNTPGADIVTNVDATSASLSLPSLTSTLQSEQVLSAMAKPVTSGMQLVESTGTFNWGASPDQTAADTDPGTGTSSASQAATVTQAGTTSGSQLSPHENWKLALTEGATDSIDSASTLAATSSTKCNDTSGTAVTDNQVCAAADSTPGGVESAALTGYGNTIEIATVEQAATTSRAYTTLYPSPGSGSVCPTTSGAGCVHAGANYALGAVTAGGLPGGGTVTSGFNAQLLTLTGYTVSSSAESGIGISSPAVGTRAGSLSYWNGTAYTAVDLSTLPATGATYSMGTATGSYTSGSMTVTTSGEITVGPASVSSVGTAPCQTAACSVTTTSGALVATINYVIDAGGLQVADFSVTVNLGAVLTRTTYRAAYSG